MNLNKLVRMARDPHPNIHLAERSSYWEENSTAGNPVRHALSLWWHRWFRVIDLGLLALVLALCHVFHLRIDSNENNTPTIWLCIVFVLGAMPFVELLVSWDDCMFSKWRDAKKFIDALTAQETIIGKPIEEWKPDLDLKDISLKHMKALAASLRKAEDAEKAEKKRNPWAPDEKISANQIRWAFYRNVDLLPGLVGVPEAKEDYF